MAIAHVCQGCGRDLARVRASREPVYGLWVAACPGCARVSPRARRTDRALLTRVGRIYFALLRLEVRTAGLAFMVIAASMGAYALGETFAHSYPLERAGMVLLGATHLIGGAFVHLAWSHHHVVMRWAALTGIVGFIAVVPLMAWGVMLGLAVWWPELIQAFEFEGASLRARLVAAPVLAGGALLIGYPVAAGLGAMHEVVRASRWRSRLSRARTRRFAS